MKRIPIRTIIETWNARGQNSSAAARQLGIDRRAVKRWVDPGATTLGLRPLAGGAAPLHSSQTPEECAEWGDRYPDKELAVMAQAEGIEVSASTIHRYLHRVGLIHPSNCPGLGHLQMDVKCVTPELPGCPTSAISMPPWISTPATRWDLSFPK